MITAVGCCAFAGGFTWGLRDAGIHTLAHLEFPGVPGHIKTCKQNFPDLPIHIGKDDWPLADLFALEPTIVFAQPPCAPWSPAGYGPNRGAQKHLTDPRVAWTKAAFELVEKLDPEIFIYESVQPTYKKTKRSFLDPFALDCNLDGRTCYHLLINGADMGLPHNRKRYFFITSKVEIPFERPESRSPPTSLETLTGVKHEGEEPVWPRTIDKKTWDGRVSDIEPGETLLNAWKRFNPPDVWEYGSRGQVVGRPAFGNYRLHPDKPPRTFFGSYTIIHPVEDRPLTKSEIMALSGYPPEFDISAASSMPAAMVQLGQAVIPPVAKWVGDYMVRGLEENVKAFGDTIELDYCSPPPPSSS
jgi:site-specific DNA-cytosine methylase